MLQLNYISLKTSHFDWETVYTRWHAGSQSFWNVSAVWQCHKITLTSLAGTSNEVLWAHLLNIAQEIFTFKETLMARKTNRKLRRLQNCTHRKHGAILSTHHSRTALPQRVETYCMFLPISLSVL